jgi:methionyl aminopeptidase
MAVRAALTPGTLSPWRQVPATIVRSGIRGQSAHPSATAAPTCSPPEIIEKMRIAGRLAAQATVLAG